MYRGLVKRMSADYDGPYRYSSISLWVRNPSRSRSFSVPHSISPQDVSKSASSSKKDSLICHKG